MSLFVASLNSGSNGNCYYIGTPADAVLIDAGISCRETERRLRKLGLAIENVRAIFISHEHADHIYGVTRLSKKHQIPVYITESTYRYSNLKIEDHLWFPFRANHPIQVGQMTVTAFTKYHDAADPHNFVVSNEVVKVGVFTDIGVPCEQTVRSFGQCHAAFLEANYDEEMLEKGTYPIALKMRIRGGQGHLSNKQALQLFTEYRAPFMTHLFLSHLSRNNNTPKIVEELFASAVGATQMIIASRYRETKLFEIKDVGNVSEVADQKPRGFSYQLDLFR